MVLDAYPSNTERRYTCLILKKLNKRCMTQIHTLLTFSPLVYQEMWSLFDFVHQGTSLGTARTFKMEYENPITRVCI